MEIYDISTHPHTKHTHRHNDNRLPKLVLGSEEFATSLSFPRFQNFFWNNCLRSVLLCFLGTRKHNSNYSLFPWGHNVDSEEPTCRWVSMGSFLAPPPSGSPSAERNLTTEPCTPPCLCSVFPLISSPPLSHRGDLVCWRPFQTLDPGLTSLSM